MLIRVGVVVDVWQFATVEEPVRRKVNNVAWTGATTRGCETMTRMRGLSVIPERLDFGLLTEGSTYHFTMALQNTGIDACRYRVKQPPPGTGIRVLYKPGPVSGWRRGSVVRTSVFNWRTFPDLRLIYG